MASSTSSDEAIEPLEDEEPLAVPLLHDPTFSSVNAPPDHVVVYNNIAWKVHSVKLRENSGYFSSIFAGGFKEAREHKTVLEALDCDDWVFKECLKYFYTGVFDFDRIPRDANWAAKYVEICQVAKYLQADDLVDHASTALRHFCNGMVTNLSRVRRFRQGDGFDAYNLIRWAPRYRRLTADVYTEFTAAIQRLYDYLTVPEPKRILFSLLYVAGERFITAGQLLNLGDQVPEFQRDIASSALTGRPLVRRLDRVRYHVLSSAFLSRALPVGFRDCVNCGHDMLAGSDTFFVDLAETRRPGRSLPERWCEDCARSDLVPDWCAE